MYTQSAVRTIAKGKERDCDLPAVSDRAQRNVYKDGDSGEMRLYTAFCREVAGVVSRDLTPDFTHLFIYSLSFLLFFPLLFSLSFVFCLMNSFIFSFFSLSFLFLLFQFTFWFQYFPFSSPQSCTYQSSSCFVFLFLLLFF